jgi:hypothetical protein
MKQENPYVISEFTNPSGKIVFQLYARIDSKRFRKNFPTRAEAEAERQILGIQYLQETEMRVAATRLADAQLREAEAVFARVTGQPRSLSFYVDFALANYRAPVTQKLLAEAVTEFLVIKDHEREQDLLSDLPDDLFVAAPPLRLVAALRHIIEFCWARAVTSNYPPIHSSSRKCATLWDCI